MAAVESERKAKEMTYNWVKKYNDSEKEICIAARFIHEALCQIWILSKDNFHVRKLIMVDGMSTNALAERYDCAMPPGLHGLWSPKYDSRSLLMHGGLTFSTVRFDT